MSTYLLTWNPSRYNWQRLPYLVHLSAQGWPVLHDWNCENTKRIRDGDRFFMLRQGPEPNGIMGSGFVISPKPYPAKQDSSKGRTRGKVFIVDVNFDALLDPDSDPILPKKLLHSGRLGSVNWDTPRSCIQIPDDAARDLESLWQKHLAQIRFGERVARA
jgi:5-methylcytosine-specific restriction protein A